MRRLLFFVTLDMWGCCAMSLHNHKGRADLHRNNCSTFQIFTFPPFYMPTAMSIIQFRPLVCCECCGCLEDTFTCFCLWFEMTALRFWFSFLGRWKICCSLLCVTGKKSIWNWFSKDLNWNARRSAALDSWERGSKNNNLDKNFCIKEAMKINWRWTWKKKRAGNNGQWSE